MYLSVLCVYNNVLHAFEIMHTKCLFRSSRCMYCRREGERKTGKDERGGGGGMERKRERVRGREEGA